MDQYTKHNIFQKFNKQLAEALSENIHQQDKDFGLQLVNILVENGAKQFSIKASHQIFFNSLYAEKAKDFKIRKYQELCKFISEQEDSEVFFRYLYLIRIMNNIYLLNKFSTFIHDIIAQFIKEKHLFEADISRIGQKTMNNNIDISLAIHFQDVFPSSKMIEILEKTNPKSTLGNINGKLNMNPYYKSSQEGGNWKTTYQFSIVKNNKKNLPADFFYGVGIGKNKAQSQTQACKKLLTKLWFKYPQTMQPQMIK